jgi:hypothetical protein
MKITKIECHVLLVPDYRPEAGSSAQDDIVVFVHTDEGLIGIPVVMPDEIALQLHDLELIAVHFGDDFRQPLLAE